MRKSGPRSSRAKRRLQSQPAEPPKPPAGWPDVELLGEAIGANDLAARFLEEIRPETVRTILKRMETPTRKAIFERHSIPVTKVGLRAAGQVLTLVRSDETPAESPILGTMLNPAAHMFHHAHIGTSEVTGLRLKLFDLALSLLVHNDSVINGLRAWHRWAQPEFEDLTLSVVIGSRCSHSVLAAAYLAGSHADVAEKYEALRVDYPQLPEPLPGTLTATNPLSRYLAARPDRKMPATPAELRAMIVEDSKVRRAEVGQAQRDRPRDRPVAKVQAEVEPEVEPEVQAEVETDVDTEKPQTEEPRVAPQQSEKAEEPSTPQPSMLEAPAVPTVADWAGAVSASKRMTERLVAGEPPTPRDLEPLQLIFEQVTRMSRLLTRVTGRQVEPSRSAIDAGLTLILSDPQLSDRLNGVPITLADVTDRLRSLPASVSSATKTPTHEPEPTTSAPQAERSSGSEADLSDLDTMLRGSVGSRLAALAGADGGVTSSMSKPAENGDRPPTAPTPSTSRRATPEEPSDLGRDLFTVAMKIRTPQGGLAQRFRRLVGHLDGGGDLLMARCAAMPVSLIDPAAGALPLLNDPVEELSDCPTVTGFREAIAELCRQGVQPQDPAMVRLAHLSAALEHTTRSAQELLEAAETRTLKYDKATKVYRHWMSPDGTLRPLVDALRQSAPISKIARLADDCRRLGASRAVDETAAVLIDPNRTKIVAGARKSLADKFAEVLDVADRAVGIVDAIDGESHADRSASWRFDTLTRFRRQTHVDMPLIESELAHAERVPDSAKALVTRALALAINPDPLYGPEPAPNDVGDGPGDQR